MAKKESYTYDPSQITDRGLNQMRFELGDTMVEGEKETAALCDEEYLAIIQGIQSWKKAKLAVVEGIMRRFSYEVNTTIGPVKLDLLERAKHWKQMYDELKDECGADIMPSMGMPSPETLDDGGHYFWGGMHDNPLSGSVGGDRDLLPKTR